MQHLPVGPNNALQGQVAPAPGTHPKERSGADRLNAWFPNYEIPGLESFGETEDKKKEGRGGNFSDLSRMILTAYF